MTGRDFGHEDAGAGLIVLVEDQDDLRELLGEVLEEENYRTVRVRDGLAAYPTIRRVHPDLILLDFILPGKDGNEILEELTRDPTTRAIPVIVTSAYPRELRSWPQVRDILRKPFDLETLLRVISTVLASSSRGLSEEVHAP